MMTLETMEQTAVFRAARGAAWLDENFHGWAASIDLGKLDLADSNCCILGQLRPNGWRYLECVSLSGGINWATLHGFEQDFDPDHAGDTYWRMLNAAWTNEVKDRFNRGIPVAA